MIISFNDVTGLTLYVMIFDNQNNQVWNVSLDAWETFDNGTINDYILSMTEDGSRAGYYYVEVLDELAHISSILDITIEIRRQVDGSPDITVDELKGETSFYWNGSSTTLELQNPHLEGHDFIGVFTSGQLLNTTYYLHNEYDQLDNILNNRLNYAVFNPSNALVSTGYTTLVSNPVRYNLNTNIGFTPGTYRISVSGYYDGILRNTSSHFTVVSSGYPVQMNQSDIITALGYASGKVDTGSSNVTGFITNLPASYNSHYNGQILRFTNGNLIGQGRIISAYNGTSKKIDLNKGLSAAPSSGDNFIIYAIGGEYNVP